LDNQPIKNRTGNRPENRTGNRPTFFFCHFEKFQNFEKVLLLQKKTRFLKKCKNCKKSTFSKF
jgi:hypothetical protein